MLPPSNRDAGAKARAAAAAAVAAASVTPGQRDRAIEQAVLAAQMAREAASAASASAQQASPAEDEHGVEAGAAAGNGKATPSAAGTYEAPEWSGLPEGADFGLEVLKNGTLLEEKPLTGQACFSFGRSPTADVLLEHPTASRLHAVLQFKDGAKDVFLYDCGSTHGTFLNKNRLKACVHAPMRVGDTVRFGQSSRMYVLTGPQELLPQEGLSKQQMKQLKLLEAAQRQKEADESRARAQMEAALASGSDGATWGMGPDMDDSEQAGPGQEVNWRAYVDKHGSNLTDRQTKLLDKLRKREYKIKNLEAECAKIAAKEKTEGGLTQGQASTLVRNERALDALREELEELEDQMTDCITDSIKGKQAAKEGKEAKKKRKRQPDSDDEYANRSDSDDEFYDRTAPGPAAVAGPGSKKQAAGKSAKSAAAQQVESAETLYAKRSALIEEKERLEAAIAAEQQLLEQQQKQHKAAAGTEQNQAQQQQQPPQQQKEGQQPAPTAATDPEQQEAIDSLDAFMEDVAENIEMDKLTSLKKELDSIQQQLQRTERLIQIADPDGWYKPGSGGSAGNAAAAAAAKAAKEAAKAALEVDKQRRAAAVAAQRAGWAAANANKETHPEFEEEEEEEEEEEQAAVGEAAVDNSTDDQQQQRQGSSTASGAAGGGGSKLKPVVLKPKGILATAALRQKPAACAPSSGNRSDSSTTTTAAAAAAGGVGPDGRKAAAGAAAQRLMKEFAQPVAAAAAKRIAKGPIMPPPGYKAVVSAAKEGGSNVSAAAAARVAESIAILTSQRGPLDADGQGDNVAAAAGLGAEDEPGGWAPPAEQTGDGKTSLNAKFGY